MAEDWRVTVELGVGHGLERALDEHELEDETRDAVGGRVAVSADGPHVFLYADTREVAEQALDEVRAIVAREGGEATYALHRWHPIAEEWEAADVPLPSTEAEKAGEHAELERQETEESEEAGYAEWEVRLDLPSHRDAVQLATKLEAEGIPATRRWTYLLVGAADEDDAKALADRLRTESPTGTRLLVQPGGESAWEVAPKRSKLFYIIPNM
jgi:transcription elongation GreA/GreB family factor